MEVRTAAEVAPAQVLIVHLLTPLVVKEYQKNFKDFCTNFYTRVSSMSVLLPIPAHLFDATASRLTLINPPYHMANRTLPLLRWWPASCNRTFHLAPLPVDVPKHFSNLTARCENRAWSRDYALYSGAVFVAQFLWLPVLRRFTFYVKVDTDVHFYRPMPFDIAWLMQGREDVVIAYTQLYNSTKSTCQRGVLQAVREFRRVTTGGPGPRMSRWCEADNLDWVFFGNFVLYRTAFMTSKPVLALSRFLYYKHGGYFEARWGDQASPPAFMCHALPAAAAKSPASLDMSKDPRTLHMEGLFNRVFRHVKEHNRRFDLRQPAPSSHSIFSSEEQMERLLSPPQSSTGE